MALSLTRMIGFVALTAAGVLGSRAQAQQTILEDCIGPTSVVCSNPPVLLPGDSCGTPFYRFNGRIAWPPLKNVGPVTISIQSRRDPYTLMPLYVEIRNLVANEDTTACNPDTGGVLLLTDFGGAPCGGTWTTVGPFDLRPFGVRMGEFYRVQVAFFETRPWPTGERGYSPGFSCIRLTAPPTPVAMQTWGHVKRLFR